MSGEGAFWAMIGAVTMAAINSTASVLMLWIRARYKYTNGKYNGNGTTMQSPK